MNNEKGYLGYIKKKKIVHPGYEVFKEVHQTRCIGNTHHTITVKRFTGHDIPSASSTEADTAANEARSRKTPKMWMP